MFSFNHVTIGVSNVNKSISFYEKFGFTVEKRYMPEDKNMEIVWMKKENMILEMFWYNNHDELPEHSKTLTKDLPTIGNKHFGLGVKSIDDAAKFVIENGLCDEDINITEGRMGKKYFFIKDPDGILMEVIEEGE